MLKVELFGASQEYRTSVVVNANTSENVIPGITNNNIKDKIITDVFCIVLAFNNMFFLIFL